MLELRNRHNYRLRHVKGSALFSPFPWSYRLYFLSTA